jgi:REP element-mobilizing transposase RayT
MDDTKPHAHRLRTGRFSQPGQIYMVTMITAERRRIFDDFSAARVLIQILKAESDKHRASTLAFVVMPDHLHWLMQLGESTALGQSVRGIKSITTHRLGQPVWQRGYHDHAVRREEDIKSLARYVIANPVRAGLSYSVGSYPHWDAAWL